MKTRRRRIDQKGTIIRGLRLPKLTRIGQKPNLTCLLSLLLKEVSVETEAAVEQLVEVQIAVVAGILLTMVVADLPNKL